LSNARNCFERTGAHLGSKLSCADPGGALLAPESLAARHQPADRPALLGSCQRSLARELRWKVM
jgi:hypothetical protein